LIKRKNARRGRVWNLSRNTLLRIIPGSIILTGKIIGCGRYFRAGPRARFFICPTEEERMRHVKLAQVIVPLQIDHEKFFLLRKNIKWNDWGLVGGHVEPNEEGRWKSTAIRECNEELAPLENRKDFLLFAIPGRPITWGPIESKSTGGTPTRYRCQEALREYTGDSFLGLAILDRMIELGEIRKIEQGKIAGQYEVYVSAKPE
jgi:8-oxo-dGTP pyrophosphatase MutT (NUDIX family)